MFVLSIIVLALEFIFNVAFGFVLYFNDPFGYLDLILFMIPLLPMAVVALIGGIRKIRDASTRKKAIATTVLAGVSLMVFVALMFLIIFAFAVGGRLPHQVLY